MAHNERIADVLAEIHERTNDIEAFRRVSGAEADRSGKGIMCPKDGCNSGSGKSGTGPTIMTGRPGYVFCVQCKANGNKAAFDVVDAIQALTGCEWMDALGTAAERLGIAWDGGTDHPSYRQTPRKMPPATPQSAKNENPVRDYTKYLKRTQAAFTDDSAGAAYIRSRGLSVDMARAAGIGFDVSFYKDHAPRVVIPTDNGGYVARFAGSNVPDGVERVENAAGYHVTTSFAAALDGTDPVHIVEGWADALAVMSAGGAAVSLNSTSNIGKLIARLDTMETVPPLILALDPDDAGTKTRNTLAAYLDGRHARYTDSTVCLEVNGAQLDPCDSYAADPPAFAHAVAQDVRRAMTDPEKRSQITHSSTGESGARVLCADGAATYGAAQYRVDVDAVLRYRERRTGFANIDAFGPFFPGLYCIGAITSLGKTTFCTQLADYLAARGEHVLYFSIEQDRRVMHSKGIARYAYDLMGDAAPSGMEIASGARGELVDDADAMYCEDVGDRLTVYAEPRIRPMDIDATVRDYANRHGMRPTVFVDYVQRLRPDDPRANERAAMDSATATLQGLVLDVGATVIAVSSLNRAAYLQPISFESVKESGGLEFTADVFWGLELGCMRAPMFEDEKGVVQKRNIIRTAKAEIPREVRLVCLKNRFGMSSYEALFLYRPDHEHYEALTLDDPRILSDDAGNVDFRPPTDRNTWRDLLKPGNTAPKKPKVKPPTAQPIEAAELTGETIVLNPRMIRAMDPYTAQELYAGLNDPRDRARIRGMVPSAARKEFVKWIEDTGRGGPVRAETYTDTPALPAGMQAAM